MLGPRRATRGVALSPVSLGVLLWSSRVGLCGFSAKLKWFALVMGLSSTLLGPDLSGNGPSRPWAHVKCLCCCISCVLSAHFLCLSQHVLLQMVNHQKLMELIRYSSYFLFWCLYAWILCKSWRLEIVFKDRKQAPPNLALCSSSSKVQGTKMSHLLDMISTYKLFLASPAPVNILSVYHRILSDWIME